MSTKLVYNPDLMKDISDTYARCEKNTDDLLIVLDETLTLLSANYTGQADEIVSGTFAKLKEHLEMLRECFKQTGTYVSSTIDTMQETDAAIAKGVDS